MDRRLEELKEIFFAGVKRVDPYEMIRRRVRIEGSRLLVADESAEIEIDLAEYDRIFVHGAGKATAKMALAIEELLGDRLTDGVISVKAGHTERLSRVRIIEAGHPVPNKESVRAAHEIAELCRRGDERSLYIGLISGGGSACLCYPREWDGGRIQLQEKQAVTGLLLSCGADIGEINMVRKHLSGIKGGQLARLIRPAASLNLILSDVVGDRLDSIASGLTVADNSSFSDAQGVIDRYGLHDRLPDSVKALLAAGISGRVSETPKHGDPIFDQVQNVLLGTNLAALRASGERAKELGYEVRLLSSQITGEAREAAKFYLGIALDIAEHGLAARRPACIIGGGETTVTVSGAGKGGRNQELALAFLHGLSLRGKGTEGIYFLSAGTDGNDGPTDAAGAFACNQAIERAAARKLPIQDYLVGNDSYTFFDAIDHLFKSGPTNTNVCDLQILLVV
ncbi:MAG TPA: glycerate kinase [Spirochaetia bacterium]|nr:glycerate kinase [Spirochaetia bacterium]